MGTGSVVNSEYEHFEAAGPDADSRHRLAGLARVVREVDAAPDLEAALDILVRRTRALMGVDVCTVYFADEEAQRLVVAASDGLSSRVVGRVQTDFGRGLIGQVAESRRTFNLEQVPSELDQDFLLQVGAGAYMGFLGVPVVHKTRVQGVLLVRQREARCFDDNDEALLTTLAAQLGGAIAHAKASGEWCEVCRAQRPMPKRIAGIAGAPGLAIGRAVAVFDTNSINKVPDRITDDIPSEEARLREAVRSVRAEVATLDSELEGTLAEADRALFQAYGLMLESPELWDLALSELRRGNWAPGAVSRSFETLASRFDTMEDDYLRGRAVDIRALGGRLLARLSGGSGVATVGQGPTILVGQSLSAIDIGHARRGNLVGIVSGDGSFLSHAAILARALGIPAVVGVSGLPLAQLDGQELGVDGGSGQVHLRLDPALRQALEDSIEGQRTQTAALESVRELEAVTPDGVRVGLFVNAGLAAELTPAAVAGAAGIGLFRTELPFMLFDRLPSEQEQKDIYRQVLQTLPGLPVTLRTLDAGGDKRLPYLSSEDANPALGWRGIRITLDHPEIFLTQLRALLRADLGLGNLRLLLPTISGIEELEQSLLLLERAMQQLGDEGLAVSRPPVGAMIEVPAAVHQIETLARHVEFLSVGTNDLTQYLLAMDRNNSRVSARLDPAHPALLQALRQVVDSARRAGVPVGVCGEIAGDPAIALLLLGMGFDSLSMSPSALPRVKWGVRAVAASRMRALAAEALRCERVDAVHRLLAVVRNEIGLERLTSGEGPGVGQSPPTEGVV